ncbi:MAG: glycosyltransferase, partial [Bacteroidota bacterium]|nr:glycosyltransferase [Bacteroidota bacterium]
MNILYLTPDFNYGDGRSYYVYLLLKYFHRTGHNVYLCTNKGDSFDRLAESGIQVYTFTPLSLKTSFIKSVGYVSDIIKKNNISLIHSHHRYYELLAVAAAGDKNVHTVFTALSLVNKRYFVEYRSDSIIAVSRAVKDHLIEKFKVDEKTI